MHKTAEQEQKLKLAIRDIVAQNPIIAVYALQAEMKRRGFQTPQGNTLDRHYVAKFVRKLNHEKALAVDQEKVNEGLAALNSVTHVPLAFSFIA